MRLVWVNEVGGRTFEVGDGAGLRALHTALPVPDCPFSWSVQDRIDEVRRRAG